VFKVKSFIWTKLKGILWLGDLEITNMAIFCFSKLTSLKAFAAVKDFLINPTYEAVT
jgi:hypothetical protein